MSRIKFLAFVGLSLVLFSCQKWKEPTDVDFYVDMDKSATLNNQLIFTTGQIVIESFDFDADREKGDDVLFEQEYSAGLIMPFDPNNQVTELDFVIPQGVYKRVDIGFRTFDDGNDQLASILVEGTYSYTGGGSAPFKFEFTDSQEYKIRAENDSGGDIILDKDVMSPAKIIMDPPYWFETVPITHFENATLIDVGGVNTIVINKSTNDLIYDIVLDRLDESSFVIFNY